MIELVKKVKRGEGGGSYPATIRTPALRAIYNNLPEVVLETAVAEGTGTVNPDDALRVDRAVRRARMDDWRRSPIKENRIRSAIPSALRSSRAHTLTVFEIVKAQRGY